MPYEVINGDGCINSKTHVVDLRSDTITRPTSEMRKAMAIAEVGDDVFEEDPTVTKLEKRAAALLGKEAAAFIPSGTMANLIAIMVHCSQRGSEMIAGDNSHTFLFEQGGPAVIAGVHSALVHNNDDGTFSLEEVQRRIRVDPDCHEPCTSLIIVENTHNMCGGKVLPLEWLDDLYKLASAHKIPIHMDGARLMNAAVQSKIPVNRIVRDMESVCFCLSKGLGCPIGSLLCGTRSFIAKAKRTRKVLGGGMRQTGIVAAAGLVALDNMIDRLQIDHDHTYRIAKAIDDMDSDIFRVELSTVQTNILMVYLNQNKITAKKFLHRLATVVETDSVKVSVRGGCRNTACIRFVLHWEITDKDVTAAIDKIRLVIRETHSQCKTNGTTNGHEINCNFKINGSTKAHEINSHFKINGTTNGY